MDVNHVFFLFFPCTMHIHSIDVKDIMLIHQKLMIKHENIKHNKIINIYITIIYIYIYIDYMIIEYI